MSSSTIFSAIISTLWAISFVFFFKNLDYFLNLIEVVDSVDVRVDSVFADHIFFLFRSHVADVSGIFEGAFAHESGALSAIGVPTIEQVEFVFFAPYLEVVAVRAAHSYIIRTYRLQSYVKRFYLKNNIIYWLKCKFVKSENKTINKQLLTKYL